MKLLRAAWCRLTHHNTYTEQEITQHGDVVTARVILHRCDICGTPLKLRSRP